MKLTIEQIEAIGKAAPELADKLEAGEAVTVERESIIWSPRESFLYRARHAKETNAALSLLAYREEFAPGYVVPDCPRYAFYPMLDIKGFWGKRADGGLRSPTAVYMPDEVVDALCRKLNSGEVAL